MDGKEKKRISDIDSFMKNEYSIIADAHFNVSQRITSFFQYMLAIYAAPLILFDTAIIIDETTKGLVFIFISVIGFFICMYANQLRCESLLYSRTVNAARLYNFDKMKDIKMEKYQVLPIQKEQPSYKDNYQFIWIVFTASAINAGYSIYGIILLKSVVKNFIIDCLQANWEMGINNVNDYTETLIFIIVFVLYFVLQYKILNIFTKRTEAGLDLYKQRIGVDIDGVIGNHEQIFCEIYNEIKNPEKPISCEQLTKIPVSKIKDLEIDEKDERRVFALTKYWSEMPLIDSAKQIMQKIHNTFGFEIYIFSWRDWGRKVDEFCSEKFKIGDITVKWLKKNGILKDNRYNRLREKHIEKLVTREWRKIFACSEEAAKQNHINKIRELEKSKCIYKKLYLEKGNYNLPTGIKGALYKNRFYYSKKWKIKYFIEDEPIKARKLAAICKYVFLINHPYNKDEVDLPFNVIRVCNWVEIYDKIKELN